MKWDRLIQQRGLDELAFLVVEEHGLERWALDRMLREMGATSVAAVANAADALELAKASPQPFDIVFWEVGSKADESGECLSRIIEGQPAASVIFVTALDRGAIEPFEASHRARGVRVVGTIERPVTSEKLAALIEAHGRGAASPPQSS